MKKTIFVPIIFLTVAGCGGSSLPDPADPGQAVSALRTALDSWQKGEPADALHARKPPLYHNDKDRTAGKRLASFRIDEKTDMHGRQVRCSAALTFAGSGEKIVRYLIDTHPSVVITREEL